MEWIDSNQSLSESTWIKMHMNLKSSWIRLIAIDLIAIKLIGWKLERMMAQDDRALIKDKLISN